MKKFVIGFLIIMSSVVWSAPPSIMGVQFGLSKSTIVKQYKSKHINELLKDRNFLNYEQTIMPNNFGLTDHCLYFDDNKKLGKIVFYVDYDTSSSAWDLLYKFETLKNALIEKYGNISKGGISISPEYDTVETRFNGFQLGYNNGVYIWNLYDTDIVLIIESIDDTTVLLTLTYEYKPVWDKHCERRSLQSKVGL